MSERPTIERLREVLGYEPTTGILRWLVTNSNVAVAGTEAGSHDGRYVRIKVDGSALLAHRVIWAIVTGAWPTFDIDHKDTDGYNNRWGNLRQATMSQNIANSRISKRNTSGFKGVTKNRKRWVAQITHERKHYYLGIFDSPEAAHEVYLAEAARLQGPFARAA